jgi:hypothetical protein
MLHAVLQKTLEVLPLEKREPLLQLAREALHRGGGRINREYVGILAEDVPLARAQQLANELRAVGVETQLRAMKQLVPNPRAVQIHNADCVLRGFVLQDAMGGELVLPWDKKLMMCAVAIKQEVKEQQTVIADSPSRDVGAVFMAPRGFGSLRPGYRPVATTRTVTRTVILWVLDIYTLTAMPHVRIIHNKFNYDYLGERKGVDGRQNFRLMAQDLDRFAPKAARNEAFDEFVRGGELPLYESIKRFDEENRWRLQWLRQ